MSVPLSSPGTSRAGTALASIKDKQAPPVRVSYNPCPVRSFLPSEDTSGREQGRWLSSPRVLLLVASQARSRLLGAPADLAVVPCS